MSDNLLKLILEKLDSQQLELKELKEQVGVLDNKVENLDNKVGSLDNKVENLDNKVENLDKNLDYNTQMTKQTLQYALSIDKHQQENHRYLTEKMVVHDKEIFHINEKLNN
ncbi:hypothetical protein [Natribacillus halophilus]|uniref:Uncharacterized protein n=1 Tax=Natribacillus halophilus TaxID=549003 RepID=A0A1G8MUG7_9BACI|nr:hypothetical protein [Natribacillus halophilus]SDI71631.1 hypothetical protein SAMN04488123_10534 [Natribacillus halophilus]